MGESNALIKSHKTDQSEVFGLGKDKTKSYWTALIRQILVHSLLYKEIESYGIVKVSEKGYDFIKKPESFMMAEDHDYSDDKPAVNVNRSAGSDTKLLSMLKDLRKKVAKQKQVPPFVIFQDPSLDDMALKYPITLEELSNVHGVGESKAKKFGKPL